MYRFQSITFITFVICLFSGVSSWAAHHDKLETSIKQFAKQHQLKSISVGVVNGKQHYTITEGKQQHYLINSMSKSFTSLLLSYEVVQHRVTLTAPVKNYVSELAKSPVGNISVLNFVTHTSGLPFSSGAQLDKKGRADAIAYLRQWRPSQPVGARRIYSNDNIGLLGYVIEAIEKISYAQALKKIIITPYGL